MRDLIDQAGYRIIIEEWYGCAIPEKARAGQEKI